MTLETKRRYVIECFAGKSKLKRIYYTMKVQNMREGEVIRLYNLFADKRGAGNE